MAVHTPRPLALLRISPNVGKKRALPTHPQHHGLQGSEPLRCDAGLPGKVLHLPSSGSCISAAWWGKLRLLRGNFQIWQGRISFDGASVRTTVIYGAWHSHDYIHTHAHVSSPVFPAPLPHNFWPGNIILVSGKPSFLWDR